MVKGVTHLQGMTLLHGDFFFFFFQEKGYGGIGDLFLAGRSSRSSLHLAGDTTTYVEYCWMVMVLPPNANSWIPYMT